MHPAPTHATVLLVDDQPFMRDGIRRVLQDYEDVQVVAEAKDGREAIQYTRLLRPDVVLMDISMPEMNGVEATRMIKREDPETIVIGLSIFEADTMPHTLGYAGFTTYLNKECIVEDLYPTIVQSLHRGVQLMEYDTESLLRSVAEKETSNRWPALYLLAVHAHRHGAQWISGSLLADRLRAEGFPASDAQRFGVEFDHYLDLLTMYDRLRA